MSEFNTILFFVIVLKTFFFLPNLECRVLRSIKIYSFDLISFLVLLISSDYRFELELFVNLFWRHLIAFRFKVI